MCGGKAGGGGSVEMGHVEMGEHVVPVGDCVGGAYPGDGGVSGGSGGVEGGVSSCEEDKVVDLHG